ncbi:MAG: hypothetical protein L0Z50_34140 [Verrucomicrobiales bacterium]|nr:hypothetical protein [Verrucomicrobiales bacterium]
MKPEPVPPHSIEQIVRPTPPELPDGAIVPARPPLNILKYRAINIAEKQRFQASHRPTPQDASRKCGEKGQIPSTTPEPSGGQSGA